MSEKYVPLYRKYRPQTLEEIVGQEHIKKALANAINLNKLTHAYLFTGPRGTGKTSTARILAKSLNCQKGLSVNPCGECPSCVEITSSIPVDVIEIDAASNRKVEDARNILEKVQYVPVNGKYKIYIIDEVHMLTKEAFNTLLKTLEEPPENVIFILATTEPHKVLDTIISRCQRFDFRRITTEDIIEYLKKIAKKETINIDDEALSIIAKSASGGMRDSLALLDQVSVLGDSKKIGVSDVNTLLGRLSFEVLFDLSDKILNSKPQDAIEVLDKIYNSGNEPNQIMLNLLGYFKNLLIVKNCTDKNLLSDLTQLNDGQIKNLQTQSQSVDTHQIVFLIERTSYYLKELKTSNNQHLWLEVSMIDLANLAQNSLLIQLQERISRLESGGAVTASKFETYKAQPASVSIAKNKVEVESNQNNSSLKEEKVSVEKVIQKIEEKLENKDFSPMPKAQGIDVESKNLMGLWVDFLELMNKKNSPTCAMLKQRSKPYELSAEQITIICENQFYLNALSSDLKKAVIVSTAEEFFNAKNIKLLIRLPLPTDEIKDVEKKKVSSLNEKKKLNSEPVASNELVVDSQDDSEEEILEEVVSLEQLPKKTTEKVVFSDQVNMVMKLFDGKYID